MQREPSCFLSRVHPTCGHFVPEPPLLSGPKHDLSISAAYARSGWSHEAGNRKSEASHGRSTMRIGSTAKLLAKRKLKYQRLLVVAVQQGRPGTPNHSNIHEPGTMSWVG